VVTGLRAKGLAESTITCVHGVISGTFLREIALGHLVANPAAERRKERGLRRRRRLRDKFLVESEYAILERQLPDQIAEFCEVLIQTGMRWGEVAALEAEDVTLGTTPCIHVRRTLHTDEFGHVEVHPAKAESQRTIVIDAGTARLLRRRIMGRSGQDKVFPAPKGNWWTYPDFYRYWRRAVVAARKDGLAKPVTIHWLRHTHGSWLLAAGRSLLEVSRRLGHSSINQTADIYSHLIPDGDDQLRAALADLRVSTRPGLRAVR
jgi:integrase